MTYHEFLRAVLAAVNKPGRPLDGRTYDRMLVSGLQRMRPELYSSAKLAGALDAGSITALMKYLEAHWPSLATAAPHPQGAPTT
jgi:hypothetical protein